MQFNEPRWISLDPAKHSVFETLVSFIDSASTDLASVQHLANSTITTLLSTSTQDPSVEQYRAELRLVYGILFTILTQLSAAAVQQDYLITLVISFRNVPVPATVTESAQEGLRYSEMNRELRNLVGVWTDFAADAPLHPRPEDRFNITGAQREQEPWQQEPGRHLTGDAWANINAFVARLHTAAPDLVRLDLRGLFAMIEALEQPLTTSRLDDVLPAAASWIIYAGDELKRNDVPYADFGDDYGTKKLPSSKGELWTGPHAFSQARWEFWMQRFKDIAERPDVSDTVRVAALHAFEVGSS